MNDLLDLYVFVCGLMLIGSFIDKWPSKGALKRLWFILKCFGTGWVLLPILIGGILNEIIKHVTNESKNKKTNR